LAKKRADYCFYRAGEKPKGSEGGRKLHKEAVGSKKKSLKGVTPTIKKGCGPENRVNSTEKKERY